VGTANPKCSGQMDQITDIRHLSKFSQHLLELLDRVEYRRVVTPEDMEAVGSLRAQSYSDRSIFVDGVGEKLVEDLDFDSHAYVFGMFIDEDLVSTLRIHHVTPEHRIGNSVPLFGDIIHPMLDQGLTFIDPSRFATDQNRIKDIPAIPYLTLRIATMASEYFEVDHCLASCKTEHAAFYKRVFGFNQLGEPRYLSAYRKPAVLCAEDPSNRQDVARRFPVFKSHPYEQRLLFSPVEEGFPAPLSIFPTARYADAVSRAVNWN
jgi:hypothetical protein